MPDHDQHRLIDTAQKLVEVILWLPSTLKHLAEAEAGFPSVASGGNHEGGSQEVDEDGKFVLPSTIVERLAVNAAMGNDDEARRKAIELRKAMNAIVREANTLWGICATWHRTPARPTHAKGDIPDDWCHSCYRNGQKHEPITRRPDGSPYYATFCRWCGGFKANEGRLPDMAELDAHHTGRRVRVKAS